MMTRPITLLSLMAMSLFGCATASHHSPAPAPPPWPEGVSKECPQRDRHLECFRSAEIRQAMWGLRERFNACHPFTPEPVKVILKLETLGGSPTCVEASPAASPAAACLTDVIAHHFKIPGSRSDEPCSLDYPILFNLSDHE